jgi:HD-GYP domain-containing protein (c-di-GMP phosphodiesterase class II)
MYRKVKSHDLRIGMFVADLDRPWMDTPFLLQGFLIEDEEQLQQVVDCCEWVMIDPQRSTGSAYEAPAKKKPVFERREIDPAEPRVLVHRVEAPTREPDEHDAAAARAYRKDVQKAQNAADSAPKGKSVFAVAMRTGSQATDALEEESTPIERARRRTSMGAPERDQGRGFFGSLKDSARNLFSRRAKDGVDYSRITTEDNTELDSTRPTFIPETVELTIYENKRTVEEEIAVAHQSFTRTSDLLNKVTEDIRSGNNLQIDAVEEVIDEMVESMVRNPDAMMWVARMREQNINTYGHGLNVAVNLVAFGRHLGYPKASLSHLGLVGMLLDVGKIKLPVELLEKQDNLTAKEFELVKKHVQYGIDILHSTPNVHPNVMDGVAQHHERLNGTGYPFKLVGNDISVFGRMAGIADSFSAMTQARPYAETASPHEALQTLSDFGGTQFHAEMLEQFIQSIGAFPVGSLVELSTGEVAVVATHNKLRRLKPKVLVITEPSKDLRKFPTTFDLLYDTSEKPVYIRRGLPSNAYGLDPREFYLH